MTFEFSRPNESEKTNGGIRRLKIIKAEIVFASEYTY